MQGRWGVIGLSMALGFACGCGASTEDGPMTTAGTGAGGSAVVGAGGSGGSGVAAGAGGASSAGATSAGAATGGASTHAGLGCPNGYDPPQLLFAEDATFTVNGPSVTGDELQIFYSRGLVSSADLTEVVLYRTRASVAEPFGPAQTLPELANVCAPNQHVNPDISEDGLTLYVTCTADAPEGMSEGQSPLRVARRANPSGSFTLDTAPIGTVFASAGLSPDELTAYTGGEIWETAPQMFVRASKTAMFGAPQAVPGLTEPLNSPDISVDGLTLFGSGSAADARQSVVKRASRTSTAQPFGALAGLDFGMPTLSVGAPNVAASCTLYLVVVGAGTGQNVQVARYQQPLL